MGLLKLIFPVVYRCYSNLNELCAFSSICKQWNHQCTLSVRKTYCFMLVLYVTIVPGTAPHDKFAQTLGQVLEWSDIAKSMERVWRRIYSTNHVYIPWQKLEICLPKHERRSFNLRRHDLSASTEYLDGYVATPKVSSIANTFYIVHMYSGLWIFNISTKFLNLVTRKTLRLNLEVGMLRLPIFAYSSGDHLCLDPMIPFAFPEKELLNTAHRGDRAIYDLEKLSHMAEHCRRYIPNLAETVEVGSVWQLGESEQVGCSRFANTEAMVHSHQDIVDYRKYMLGDTYINKEMGIFGLRLVDPKDQGAQLEASAEIDTAVMLVCKEGLLCTLPLDKQETCNEYKRNVSSQCADVVALLGTRIFPFEDLTDRVGMHGRRKSVSCQAQASRGHVIDARGNTGVSGRGE